jgi:hypothetical protein
MIKKVSLTGALISKALNIIVCSFSTSLASYYSVSRLYKLAISVLVVSGLVIRPALDRG